jgi:adenylate cyclase
VAELLCRHVDEGSELAARAAALSAEHGFVQWRPIAAVLSGWALIQRGQTSQGTVAVERGLAELLANGGRYFSGFAYGILAEGHLRGGAIAEGLVAADAGLTVARTTLDRTYEPEVWRIKGELLSAMSPARAPDEAERCLLRARELAQSADAKSLELRAAASLARVWAASDRRTDARVLLNDALRWFDGRGETADLLDARTVLAGLTSG